MTIEGLSTTPKCSIPKHESDGRDSDIGKNIFNRDYSDSCKSLPVLFPSIAKAALRTVF